MSYIKITEAQATALRGKYGAYHALDPIALADGSGYILTDAVLSVPAFASVLATLQALPTYAQWQSGVAYSVNTVVEYQGKLWKCVQAHTSQSDWSPPVVPALFIPAHRDGVTPPWEQPSGAHDAYPLGYKVTHNNKVWQSLIAANVWQPGAVGSESLWQQVAL